jgi:deoxyribodipyrimidine photo-lyase
MTPALETFPPTHTAALERLSRFLPHAGRAYGAKRNTDAGPGRHDAVSTLSPYIRTRVITEAEVLQAVLGRHSLTASEKFVQEVFWRTYWKGWLELRPGVWQSYQAELARDWDTVQTQSGLRDRWVAACQGETGIECFDFWAREIAETGYLHNHARMWFASIWIFTLHLPWTLGADFFLRHLLDGDPASNTLGWRWVGGLQTRGKTYLARPDNIAKFTNGRFVPPKGQLASAAPPLEGAMPPAPRTLPPTERPSPGKRSGLLLHTEDLSPGHLLDAIQPESCLRMATDMTIGPLKPAVHVAAFRDAAAADMTRRWADRLGADIPVAKSLDAVRDWAARENIEQIVTPYAPVGPEASRLATLNDDPQLPPVVQLRRTYDSDAWPHATKGFFPFKKKIPHFLAALGLG